MCVFVFLTSQVNTSSCSHGPVGGYRKQVMHLSHSSPGKASYTSLLIFHCSFSRVLFTLLCSLLFTTEEHGLFMLFINRHLFDKCWWRTFLFMQNFCAAKTLLATLLKGVNATGGILERVNFPSALGPVGSIHF